MSRLSPIPSFVRGDAPSASQQLNPLLEELERVAKLSTTDRLSASYGATGMQLRPVPNLELSVAVVSNLGSGAYTVDERTPIASGGWQAGPRTGLVAYERNLNPFVPIGKVLPAVPGACTAGQELIFDYCCTS